jgi:hypothetical protein
MRARLPEAVARPYEDARGDAYAKIGLPETRFPTQCEWTTDQILAPGFWPEAAD